MKGGKNMANPNNYEKHKHLIGTLINGWKILDIKVYPEKHHVFALAQHYCGRVKETPLTKINNNSAKCECERIKGAKERIIKKYSYLINTTINGWTILDIIPPDEEHEVTFALCQCCCGTIKEVNLKNIRRGYSKDCGCGRNKTIGELFSKDLVGQKFGRLLVVEDLEERSRTGHKLYRCKCDCGNEAILKTNFLTTLHVSSCGCLASHNNAYIQSFLERNKIDFKSEYTVWVGDNYYRFDFYLPKYNLFIEYDGEQHYMPIKFYSQSDDEANHNLEKTQEHDRIKNLYCEENNINLLRIPYWEKENIETIINNHLQRLSTKGFVEPTTEYATV